MPFRGPAVSPFVALLFRFRCPGFSRSASRSRGPAFPFSWPCCPCLFRGLAAPVRVALPLSASCPCLPCLLPWLLAPSSVVFGCLSPASPGLLPPVLTARSAAVLVSLRRLPLVFMFVLLACPAVVLAPSVSGVRVLRAAPGLLPPVLVRSVPLLCCGGPAASCPCSSLPLAVVLALLRWCSGVSPQLPRAFSPRSWPPFFCCGGCPFRWPCSSSFLPPVPAPPHPSVVFFSLQSWFGPFVRCGVVSLLRPAPALLPVLAPFPVRALPSCPCSLAFLRSAFLC